MNLKKYFDLPESINADEARMLIEELLSNSESLDKDQALQIGEALVELADKQWHTYERLVPSIRKKLDDWIAKYWDRNSLASTSNVISIVGHIGLPDSAMLLEEALKKSIPDDVRNEIKESLREFGATVDDPYFGLKRNLGRT